MSESQTTETRSANGRSHDEHVSVNRDLFEKMVEIIADYSYPEGLKQTGLKPVDRGTALRVLKQSGDILDR